MIAIGHRILILAEISPIPFRPTFPSSPAPSAASGPPPPFFSSFPDLGASKETFRLAPEYFASLLEIEYGTDPKVEEGVELEDEKLELVVNLDSRR